MAADAPHYGTDLAMVHHRGFAAHAESCAPGIVELLKPVRERGGLVLELGCGSGVLTRHLLDAGHRVIASDASPAMLELAREVVPDAQEVRRIRLPDDPLPPADAVVSVGHVLNYLPDEAAIERALAAVAAALRPGALLVLDLCDLRWAQARAEQPSFGRAENDWAIITEFSIPAPNRYVREITTFARGDDGSWRRAFERHVNVLVDTAAVPRRLGRSGVRARLHTALGDYALPEGLVAVIGERQA